jgi:hypothetical protein
MTSSGKVANNKIVEHIEIYNFYFDHFFRKYLFGPSQCALFIHLIIKKNYSGTWMRMCPELESA